MMVWGAFIGFDKCSSLIKPQGKISASHFANSIYKAKVVVPSLDTLSWDACSMTHLETHSSMHLKWTQYIDRCGTRYKSGMGTTTLYWVASTLCMIALTLMEDGTSVHCVALPAKWRCAHRMRKLDRPPNSLDLNLIENV
jgi:hypothetical protein